MKEMKALSCYLTEYIERNNNNAYKPVAVGRYGIRLREDIYSKELAQDYSKNKLIYNNTLTVGMGSVQIDIGILTDEIIYSVSPAYHTYRINGINADYLRYCLECRNADMFARYVKRGSRQGKSIDLKRWLTYEIPVYDSEKQQDIVERLDFITNLINKRKAQLQKLDDLVKSQFIEMFGELGTDKYNWGLITLGECCEVNPKKSNETRLTELLEVSFVPMPCVSEKGDIDTSNKKLYSEVQSGFTYFSEGDVLFAKITPCMENGKGAVARGLINGVGFGSTEFHVLRPNKNKCIAEWIYAVTSFETFRQDAAGKMTGSAGQRRVPASFLANYKVALPPLDKQNEFARFVEQTDKSKVLLEKSATILLKLINLVFYLVYIEKSNVLCYNIHSTEEL